MLTTTFNTLFLVAYLLSAAVQYNDSDALAWIAIYLSAAAMCITWYLKRLPKRFPAILLTIALVWIGSLLPGILGQVTPAEVIESISMKTRSVEEAREIGGLALVAIWAAVLAYRRGR